MNKPNLSFVKWPSADDILQSMNQLQSESTQINSKMLIQYFLWSRFDPRLSEQLVHFLQIHWQRYNPLRIRYWNIKSQIPEILIAHLEFLKKIIPTNKRILYNHWFEIIKYKIKPKFYGVFFVGQFPIAGSLIKQESLNGLNIWKKWGFLSTHIPINKYQQKDKTHLSKTERIKLFQLFIAHLNQNQVKQFSVNDYLIFTENKISKRLAELDLKELASMKKPIIFSQGYTKNKKYFLKEKRK